MPAPSGPAASCSDRGYFDFFPTEDLEQFISRGLDEPAEPEGFRKGRQAGGAGRDGTVVFQEGGDGHRQGQDMGDFITALPGKFHRPQGFPAFFPEKLPPISGVFRERLLFEIGD
jgi:hypothetical protein